MKAGRKITVFFAVNGDTEAMRAVSLSGGGRVKLYFRILPYEGFSGKFFASWCWVAEENMLWCIGWNSADAHALRTAYALKTS